MKGFSRSVALVCSSFFGLGGLSAAEYVFVFHDGPQATVYDADSFELLGRPTVGEEPLKAIGVPDPDAPDRLLRIYVVTAAAVKVLSPEPPFEVLRTDILPRRASDGEYSARLTPDGRLLVVAAGDFLTVFDAVRPVAGPPASARLAGTTTSFAITPDSTRAYVAVEGSLNLIVVALDTNPPQRLAGPPELTALPEAVGAAPNFAGVYAAQNGGLAIIDPVENRLIDEISIGAGTPFLVDFDGEAPLDELFVAAGPLLSVVNLDTLTFDFLVTPPVPIKKVVSPRSDLFYLLSQNTRQVFRTTRDRATLELLRNPATATMFALPAVDLALDRGRRNLFLVFGDSGSLVRVSADAATFGREVAPPEVPVRVDVIGTPGDVVADLQVYGGEGQTAGAAAVLPRRIAARAVDADGRGVAGRELLFSTPSGGSVNPSSAITNQEGVAWTQVTAPGANPFTVRARTEQGLEVFFELNTGVIPGTGLSVVSGDFQIASAGDPFPRPTVLRTLTSGVPTPDNEITLTPEVAGVNCPATVVTGAQGVAEFQCFAGPSDSPFPRVLRVAARDQFGRELPQPLTFTVVTNAADLPATPIRETSSEIVAEAGGMVENAIELRLIRSGAATIGTSVAVTSVGFEFESEDDSLRFDPLVAPTDNQGRAAASVSFGCELGSGVITSSVNAPGLAENEFNYRVVTGPASAMAKRQGSGQAGEAGQRLNGPFQALVGRVTDRCGNPVAGAPIEFEIVPEGAVTLENAFAATNNAGEFSAIAVLGTTPGLAAVIARSGPISTAFDLVINATASRIVKIAGDGVEIVVGDTAPRTLIAAVQSEAGAGSAGIDVTFTVLDGPASIVGASSALTGADGQAAVNIVAGASIGRARIEARALGFSAVFDVFVVARAPALSTAGVVNAADFVPGMTPGGAASIFGTGLMEGVQGVVFASEAPFPTELRGVRVLVNGVEAPIIAIANVNGQEQINIQVPFFTAAPSSDATVTVDNNGVSASISGVSVFEFQPGIFEQQRPEGVFAAALHNDDFAPVTPSNPARPDEIILVFWTGGGAVTPPLVTNQPGPASPLSFVDATVNVRLDGRLLEEVFPSVFSPGLITAYQTAFRVPQDASDGDLPLKLEGLDAASQEALLPVRR